MPNDACGLKLKLLVTALVSAKLRISMTALNQKIGAIVNALTLLMAGVALVVGAAVGAGAYAWWLHSQANAHMRMPSKWPLSTRVLMTNEEYEVFKWLCTTFHDHLLMVKLPVLRFTVPISKDKNGGGARWQELLGSVYCTFTVCTNNGNVVGCVDVPGKRGLNKTNRELKESLLSDCRVSYTVLRSVKLPKPSAMRAAFLGELDIQDLAEAEATLGGNSSFHADLDSFTKEKRLAAKAAALLELNQNDAFKPIPSSQSAGFNPDGTAAFDSGKAGRFQAKWDDSFIQPDESRPAKLNEL